MKSGKKIQTSNKSKAPDQENIIECDDKQKVFLEGGLIAYFALSPDCIIEKANAGFSKFLDHAPGAGDIVFGVLDL